MITTDVKPNVEKSYFTRAQETVKGAYSWTTDKVKTAASVAFASIKATFNTLFNMLFHPLAFKARADEQYPNKSWMTFIPHTILGALFQVKDDLVANYKAARGTQTKTEESPKDQGLTAVHAELQARFAEEKSGGGQ